MMTLPLKHLQANTLIQYLAALGLLRVVASQDPQASLHWTKHVGMYHAVLTTTLNQSAIVDLLVADLEWWSNSDLLALAVATPTGLGLFLPRTLIRALLQRSRGPLKSIAYMAAFADESSQVSGEGCPLREEDQDPALDTTWWCQAHPLNVLGRNARFFPMAKALVQEILSVMREDVVRRVEQWLEGRNITTGKSATMGHIHKEDLAPALASGVVVQPDPLCEWFGCFQSIPLFPATFRFGRMETSCFEKDTWYCPVLDQPMTLPLVDCLLRMRYSTMKPREQELRGITAVYASTRIQRNQRNIYLAALPYTPDFARKT